MSQEKSKRAMASLELMAAVLAIFHLQEEAWEESMSEDCIEVLTAPFFPY